MKRNSLKFIISFILVTLIIGIFATNVKALDLVPPISEEGAKRTVTAFLTYLESGNSSALFYIDRTNEDLFKEAQNRLFDYSSINIKINKVSIKGNDCKIETTIEAKGENFKVSGINANFNVRYFDGSYKITDTNFFDVTNPGNIVKTVFTILGIVFGIIGLFVIATVIAIVIVVLNKKKKN